jgi:hypothetical protein
MLECQEVWEKIVGMGVRRIVEQMGKDDLNSRVNTISPKK